MTACPRLFFCCNLVFELWPRWFYWSNDSPETIWWIFWPIIAPAHGDQAQIDEDDAPINLNMKQLSWTRAHFTYGGFFNIIEAPTLTNEPPSPKSVALKIWMNVVISRPEYSSKSSRLYVTGRLTFAPGTHSKKTICLQRKTKKQKSAQKKQRCFCDDSCPLFFLKRCCCFFFFYMAQLFRPVTVDLRFSSQPSVHPSLDLRFSGQPPVKHGRWRIHGWRKIYLRLFPHQVFKSPHPRIFKNSVRKQNLNMERPFRARAYFT